VGTIVGGMVECPLMMVFKTGGVGGRGQRNSDGGGNMSMLHNKGFLDSMMTIQSTIKGNRYP
jgi:hypothetical protein